MSLTLLQMDFPFTGPWGEEMAAELDPLARDIAGEAGLIWKIWTENPETGRAGGIYLFADAESAERYRWKHEQRLNAYGITGVEARSFAVNRPLSEITRAPIDRAS
jgi:hypothetical protein